MEWGLGCCCNGGGWLSLIGNSWYFGNTETVWKLRRDWHTEHPVKRARDFDWMFSLTGGDVSGRKIGRLYSIFPTDWPARLLEGLSSNSNGSLVFWADVPSNYNAYLLETAAGSNNWQYDSSLNRSNTQLRGALVSEFITPAESIPGRVHEWMQNKRLRVTFPGASLLTAISRHRLDISAVESNEEWVRIYSGSRYFVCAAAAYTRISPGLPNLPAELVDPFYVTLLLYFDLATNPNYDSGMEIGPQNEPLRLRALGQTVGTASSAGYYFLSSITYDQDDATSATIVWTPQFSGATQSGELKIEYI